MTFPLRVVVTGAAGRLGAAVCAELRAVGHHVDGLTRQDVELTDPRAVSAAIARRRPHAIVNCAAYNAVDAAESQRIAAFAANADVPRYLASAASEAGAILVHYSSDFVFDGKAGVPYEEDDAPNPLGVYAASKLAGEAAARNTPRHYVLRVASLFGGRGVRGHRSTIDHIAERILAGGPVRAFSDRTVSPSYVPDVAVATRALVEAGAPHGIYHCVNSGVTTWYQLARAIAAVLGLDADIEPVGAASATSGAPRPLYCGLSNRKLQAAGVPMPPWESAVHRHLLALAPLKPAAI